MNLTIRINETQRQIIAIGLILFALSICYVPLDQTYWISFGSGDIKSGFLGNWTWITSLHSTYTPFYAGDIPATISFPILIIEWLILGAGCGLFIWVNRDKLIKEQDAELPLTDKVIVEPIYADLPDSVDESEYGNQLQESEIHNYKSLEEFVANRPDISRDQCEVLWDFFRRPSEPKSRVNKAKQPDPIDPVSAWPFPSDER